MRWIALATLLTVAIIWLVGGDSTPIRNMDVVLVVAALLAFYFLPAIVGSLRKHHNAAAILTLNLLAGWTAVGWIIALVWAMTATRAARSLSEQRPVELFARRL